MSTVQLDGKWEPLDEKTEGKDAGSGDTLRGMLHELYGMTYEQVERAIADLDASKGN